MIMTQCLKSGRITLRKPWDSLAGRSVTMTYASMRCSPRPCSRAGDLATLGTQTCRCTDIHILIYPLPPSFLDPSTGFLQHLSQVEVKGQVKAPGVISGKMEMMISISSPSLLPVQPVMCERINLLTTGICTSGLFKGYLARILQLWQKYNI